MNNIIDQASALTGLITAQTLDNTPTPATDYVMYYDPAGGGTLKRCLISSLPQGVTSVGMTVAPTAILSIAGTPITTAGTLALSIKPQIPNTILAGPASGTNATPTFRALVPSDIPITTITIASNLIDWNQGNTFFQNLNGVASRGFTFSNPNAGQTIRVALLQGTPHTTVSWPSVSWKGGAQPVMTAISGHIDIFVFSFINGLFLGMADQNFF